MMTKCRADFCLQLEAAVWLGEREKREGERAPT